MEAIFSLELQARPPTLEADSIVPLPGLPVRVEVRRPLPAAEEDELRARACLDRLVALRRRLAALAN